MIIGIEHADTWNELTFRMMGYFHDHCYHRYAGLTIDMPNELKELIVEPKKYSFVYEEDEPNKGN